MKIDKSQKMNIEFDKKEKQAFADVCYILTNLLSEMGDYQCNTIESGWVDSPIYTYDKNVRMVIEVLNDLKGAYYIYNKENVK